MYVSLLNKKDADMAHGGLPSLEFSNKDLAIEISCVDAETARIIFGKKIKINEYVLCFYDALLAMSSTHYRPQKSASPEVHSIIISTRLLERASSSS